MLENIITTIITAAAIFFGLYQKIISAMQAKIENLEK